MSGKKHHTLSIYDTTLRDGNQTAGISLSIADKLKIARKLGDQGITYIEGGWPTATASPDYEFFRKIAGTPAHSRCVVFGSTRRKGITCAKDPLLKLMLKCGAQRATIYGKSWDMHVREILRTSLSENLAMISETVAYLKKHMDTVFFDAEHYFDGYRHNPQYALKTLQAALDGGADCIVLCDTNGGTLPHDFLQIFRRTREALAAPLGVHTHNDTGCADANSFLAVSEGAVQVQGTINGLGERCGNANLCTIIPGLQLKYGYTLLAPERLKMLAATSVYVSEIVNVSHNSRQPYVGESAFSHKAGTHADGVRKNSFSFEHIPPEAVGNYRRFVVSDQAGTGTLLEKLKGILPKLDKKDPVVKQLLGRILDMEASGYQFEAADGSFELIVQEVLGKFREAFKLKGFRVIEEKRENGDVLSEATIKLQKGTDFEHTAAEGDGPVNALDNALRKALTQFYPSLKEVKLEDFKVRVLDEKEGTAAKVRVLIESSDGKDRWGTVGVSTNIIEASWLALIDSLEYKLMKDLKDKKVPALKKK
ncbi:MAG: citramalate synthase [Chitinivibrionales bacterium]|nr:citramalate synthase [Chitinivibrionales bacterium]